MEKDSANIVADPERFVKRKTCEFRKALSLATYAILFLEVPNEAALNAGVLSRYFDRCQPDLPCQGVITMRLVARWIVSAVFVVGGSISPYPLPFPRTRQLPAVARQAASCLEECALWY